MTTATEEQDVLQYDMRPAITELTKARANSGRDSLELDWPCGLLLRVTAKQAIVLVSDATPEIMETLAATDFSFAQLRPRPVT